MPTERSLRELLTLLSLTQILKMNRRLPAEFETHEAILLCYPHNADDWPGKYQAVKWAFIDFIKKVSIYEQVILVVQNNIEKRKVSQLLSRSNIDLNKIDFVFAETDRNWMRDSGPIIIEHDKKSLALDFNFNAWAKYNNYQQDNKIPQIIGQHLHIPVEPATYKNKYITLEGGAIDCNGKGVLITTKECLLDPDIQVRNAGYTKKDYENVFREVLGIKKTIWLDKGIVGDDTHGHVDDICRFINEDTVLVVEEKNKRDENYLILTTNLEILEGENLPEKRKLNVIKLPMPQPIIYQGIRLPASYANFLILNNAILVPTFNDPNDRQALGIISEILPDHDVIGIHALDLVWGFGTLHCLSHEIPKINH